MIKSKDSIVLPDFIMDSSCPLFIIREFIASIFGKSGIMPSLIDNCFTNIQLVIDVNNKKVVDIINLYTQLSIILKNNFEIETKIKNENDINLKKNDELIIDTISNIRYFILIIMIILLVIGFLIYLGEKKYQYNNKFKFLTFLFGKPDCNNKLDKISIINSLKYSFK